MNTLILCLVNFLALADGNPLFSVINSDKTHGPIKALPYHVVYTVPFTYQPTFMLKSPSKPEPKMQKAEEAKTRLMQTVSGVPFTIANTVEVPTGPLIKSYHAQSKDGAYSFGYYDGSSSKLETTDQFGNVHGIFNYVDPKGEIHTRQYVADAYGFKVAATDLPMAPVASDLHTTEETPEVKAAREKFEKIFQEARSKTRSKRSDGSSLSATAYTVPASTFPLNQADKKHPVAIPYSVPNHFSHFYHQVDIIPPTAPITYSAVVPQWPTVYSSFHPFSKFNSLKPKHTFVIDHPNGSHTTKVVYK